MSNGSFLYVLEGGESIYRTILLIFCSDKAINCCFGVKLCLVNGLNLNIHPDCSKWSIGVNVGPVIDMALIYQFLAGAKLGSPSNIYI